MRKIPVTPKCPVCNENMKFQPDSTSISGYRWVCSRECRESVWKKSLRISCKNCGREINRNEIYLCYSCFKNKENDH